MKKYFTYMLLLITTLATSQPFTKAEWVAKADAEWTRAKPLQYDIYLSTNDGGYSQPRYYDDSMIDATIDLFQSTGDFTYLDRFIYIVDSIKSLATNTGSTSFPADGYYDWLYGNDAYQLYDAHGLRNVFKMLWIMRKYPSIRTSSYNGGTYQDKYDEYLSFFTTNLYDKWLSRGCRWIMRSNSHMGSHIAGNMCLYLYLIAQADGNATKASEYLNWVDSWNNDSGYCSHTDTSPGIGIRDKLIIGSSNGYQWANDWNITSSTSNATDFSHSNAEVQTIINQYLQGIEWSLSDIYSLITTLNYALNASPDADYLNIPQYIDGIYNSSDDNRNFLNGGWEMLGAFNVILNDKLNNLNSTTLKSGFRYYQFCGNMVYNASYIEDSIIYPDFDVNKTVIKVHNNKINTSIGRIKIKK